MPENREVVARAYPVCRPYVDRGGCRSCKLYKHTRSQYADKTYCGVPCTTMDGWYVVTENGEEWHPEDIPAVDRCQVCFDRMEALDTADENEPEDWIGTIQ